MLQKIKGWRVSFQPWLGTFPFSLSSMLVVPSGQVPYVCLCVGRQRGGLVWSLWIAKKWRARVACIAVGIVLALTLSNWSTLLASSPFVSGGRKPKGSEETTSTGPNGRAMTHKKKRGKRTTHQGTTAVVQTVWTRKSLKHTVLTLFISFDIRKSCFAFQFPYLLS